jgi:hypothetical protein
MLIALCHRKVFLPTFLEGKSRENDGQAGFGIAA